MSIIQLLLLAFLLVPFLEIYLLITVGGILGAIPTIALVVFTAVLGALLLRQQGFATLQRARADMARGQVPASAMLEGLVLAFSGALLLTPGFFTDTLGFLGLIPPVRRMFIAWVLKRMTVRASGAGPGQPFGSDAAPGGHHGHRPTTIEGEYRRDYE